MLQTYQPETHNEPTFIMELLPGEPMWTAPIETVPEMLGTIHAALHKIDPGPLIKSLNEQGFEEHRYIFNKLFDTLPSAVKEFPWTRDIVEWLIENRPPEPERLAICHNGFHPGNILIQGSKVTGVLDWHLSIANTIKLITIHCKNSPGSESVDWERFLQLYLDAYRAQFPQSPNRCRS